MYGHPYPCGPIRMRISPRHRSSRSRTLASQHSLPFRSVTLTAHDLGGTTYHGKRSRWCKTLYPILILSFPCLYLHTFPASFSFIVHSDDPLSFPAISRTYPQICWMKPRELRYMVILALGSHSFCTYWALAFLVSFSILQLPTFAFFLTMALDISLDSRG